jgi:hypothetical protein
MPHGEGGNAMRTLTSGLLVAFVAVVGLSLFGPQVAVAESSEDFEFVGVKKCKTCHKKPEQGEQFRLWSESSHAKAFETLASEEALAEAKKHGIDDPQTSPDCLKCHATAFAVMDDLVNQKITMEEGVSCESCHGAGKAYSKKSVKKAIKAGETEAASVGLLEVTEETCTQCHTPEGNSFYKEFVFADRVKKIAHPIPEAAEEAEGSK